MFFVWVKLIMVKNYITCFNDLIGCFGLSPLICDPSPSWVFLVGRFNIFTVGSLFTNCEHIPSSPKIIIFAFVLWFVNLKSPIRFCHNFHILDINKNKFSFFLNLIVPWRIYIVHIVQVINFQWFQLLV